MSFRFLEGALILASVLVAQGCGGSVSNAPTVGDDTLVPPGDDVASPPDAGDGGSLPADSPGNIVGLTAYADTIFVSDEEGRIFAQPGGAGPFRLVATLSPGYGPAPLVTDGANLYFAAGPGIDQPRPLWSVPVTGGTPLQIGKASDDVDAIALDPDTIFYTTLSSGPPTTAETHVYSLPKAAGGTPRSLVTATGEVDGTDIAVSGGDVVFLFVNGSAGSGSIQRVSKTGGQPTLLVTEPNEPNGMAVDATHVYWTSGILTTGCYPGGAVSSVPLTGGSPDVLATRGPYGALAIDGATVYAVKETTSCDPESEDEYGGIVRLPAQGGVSTHVVPGGPIPVDLAFVGSSVFFVTESNRVGSLASAPK